MYVYMYVPIRDTDTHMPKAPFLISHLSYHVLCFYAENIDSKLYRVLGVSKNALKAEPDS
jgi:hypothetical protein